MIVYLTADFKSLDAVKSKIWFITKGYYKGKMSFRLGEKL